MISEALPTRQRV